MSRWTKGELTIGEIAQMERLLVDVRNSLAYLPYDSKCGDGTRQGLATLAKAITLVADVLDKMLKG